MVSSQERAVEEDSGGDSVHAYVSPEKTLCGWLPPSGWRDRPQLTRQRFYVLAVDVLPITTV